MQNLVALSLYCRETVWRDARDCDWAPKKASILDVNNGAGGDLVGPGLEGTQLRLNVVALTNGGPASQEGAGQQRQHGVQLLVRRGERIPLRLQRIVRRLRRSIALQTSRRP